MLLWYIIVINFRLYMQKVTQREMHSWPTLVFINNKETYNKLKIDELMGQVCISNHKITTRDEWTRFTLYLKMYAVTFLM